MRAAEVQVGQEFDWHAIRYALLEVIQPDVTYVSTHGGGSRQCRFVRTASSQLGETSWLLADDDEVTLLGDRLIMTVEEGSQ